MKKRLLIVILVCVVFLSLGISIFTLKTKDNGISKDVEALNNCYILVENIIDNGYDRDEAGKIIKSVKSVLDNGITEKTFKKSYFYTNDYTVHLILSLIFEKK